MKVCRWGKGSFALKGVQTIFLQIDSLRERPYPRIMEYGMAAYSQAFQKAEETV